MSKRIAYLEEENNRLGDVCDDADNEVTRLREEVFALRCKLARLEGSQVTGFSSHREHEFGGNLFTKYFGNFSARA